MKHRIFVTIATAGLGAMGLAARDINCRLNIKPDTYALFGTSGVQIHVEAEVPAKGQFWLRSGVFDQASGNVGTLEIPLGSVTAEKAN